MSSDFFSKVQTAREHISDEKIRTLSEAMNTLAERMQDRNIPEVLENNPLKYETMMYSEMFELMLSSRPEKEHKQQFYDNSIARMQFFLGNHVNYLEEDAYSDTNIVRYERYPAFAEALKQYKQKLINGGDDSDAVQSIIAACKLVEQNIDDNLLQSLHEAFGFPPSKEEIEWKLSIKVAEHRKSERERTHEHTARQVAIGVDLIANYYKDILLSLGVLPYEDDKYLNECKVVCGLKEELLTSYERLQTLDEVLQRVRRYDVSQIAIPEGAERTAREDERIIERAPATLSRVNDLLREISTNLATYTDNEHIQQSIQHDIDHIDRITGSETGASPHPRMLEAKLSKGDVINELTNSVNLMHSSLKLTPTSLTRY